MRIKIRHEKNFYTLLEENFLKQTMILRICFQCSQVYETPDMDIEFLCPICNKKLELYEQNQSIASSELSAPSSTPDISVEQTTSDSTAKLNQATQAPAANRTETQTDIDIELPTKSMMIREMRVLSKHVINNEELLAELDAKAPHGRDPNGKAYYIPQRQGEIAQREDMIPFSDRAKFTKSGWGRKLWPSMLIPMLTLFPNAIANILFGYQQRGTDFGLYVVKQEVITVGAYCLLCILLLKLIEFTDTKFVELLKPYGKNHDKIKKMFVNDVEYYRFEQEFFRKTGELKVFLPGIIAALAYLIYHVYTVIILKNYWYPIAEGMKPWHSPMWQIYSLGTLSALGMAFIALFVAMFFSMSIRGLFLLGNMGANPKTLSVSNYHQMIQDINDVLTLAQEKQIIISQVKHQVMIGGRTYYEFQRANRFIGEMLFNFSAILITYCVIGAFILVGVGYLGYIITAEALQILRSALSIIAILSFIIFLLPQLKIHSFLKNFKYQLIDVFSSLRSRLEFFYFESFPNPAIIRRLDPMWENRQDIYAEITTIKDIITEIYSYGTWSYDFPEIMKVVIMAAFTLLPLVPFDTVLGIF